MTPAQLATLKAHVLSVPALAALAQGATADYNALKDALNANASPAVKAWRTAASIDDIDDAPAYSDFDSLTAGKRDSWPLFLRAQRDFTRAKVRSWVTDVWGAATANSNSEKILNAGTESASVAENVLGGTTRTTGTVSALDRSWIGDVTLDDINSMQF